MLATISGALIGALLAGVVPVRWLELILGLALSYSAFATLQQINLELPRDVPDDWLAMRFGLEGVYYDRLLDQEVKYRATRALAMLVWLILSALVRPLRMHSVLITASVSWIVARLFLWVLPMLLHQMEVWFGT